MIPDLTDREAWLAEHERIELAAEIGRLRIRSDYSDYLLGRTQEDPPVFV